MVEGLGKIEWVWAGAKRGDTPRGEISGGLCYPVRRDFGGRKRTYSCLIRQSERDCPAGNVHCGWADILDRRLGKWQR
jgi:hypothetical protein